MIFGGQSLGTSTGYVSLDISGIDSGVNSGINSLSRMDNVGSKGLSNLEQQFDAVGVSSIAAGKAFTATGAIITGVTAVGVKGAAKLQQAFTDVKASMDPGDYKWMEDIEQMIIDIGASGQYSALDIAAVTEELVKGGFAIKQILSGNPAEGFGNMAQAVSDLSSATGSGLDPAVRGISAAMNIWHPSIVSSELALVDAAKAADIFTVAANQSAADTTDIIAGLRTFGPVAAGMGIGFEDAAAAIALFTNFGLKATVAGTALSTGMQRLAAPTGAAADTLNMLGISAWDTNGAFIGMPELFTQLRDKMGGMSAEAKMAALTTIFGAEAMDVMGIAVLDGADGLQAIIDKMSDYGIASKQAEMRTQTLQGAYERLMEGLTTTLSVVMGGLIGPMTWVANALDYLVSVFGRLPKPFQQAIGIFTALSGVALTATGAFLMMAPKIREFMTTLRLVSGMSGPVGVLARTMLRMTGLAHPFTKLASALMSVATASKFLTMAFGGVLGLGFLAFQGNLFGFGDWVRKQANVATSAWNEFKSLFGASVNETLTERKFDLGSKLDGSIFGEIGAGPDGKDWFVLGPDGQKLGQIMESYRESDGTIKMRVGFDDGTDQWLTQDGGGSISWGEGGEIATEISRSLTGLERFNIGVDALQTKLSSSGWGFLNKPIDLLQNGVNFVAKMGGMIRFWYRNLNSQFHMFRALGGSVGESIVKAFGGAWEALNRTFDIPRPIKDTLEFVGNALIPVFNDMWKAGSRAFGKLGTIVSNAFGRGITFIRGFGQALGAMWGARDLSRIDKFGYALANAFGVAGFESAARSIASFTKRVGTFRSAFREAWRDMDLMAFDGGMGNAIGSYSAWDRFFTSMAEGLRAIGLDGLADRVDKFGNKYSGTFDDILVKAKDTWERIGDSFNAFVTKADSAFDAVKVSAWDLWSSIEGYDWEGTFDRAADATLGFYGKIKVGDFEGAFSPLLDFLGKIGPQIDKYTEIGLGKVFEFSLGAVLDLTLSFMNDPATQGKKLLLGMLVSSFSILTVTGGLSAALTLLSVVGLAALAVAVVKQVVDYFRSNPDARAKIGMKIDMIYTKLEDLPIVGLFFQFGRFVFDYFWKPIWDVGNAIHRWMSKQEGFWGGFIDRIERMWMGMVAIDLLEKLGASAFMGKHLDEAGNAVKGFEAVVQGLFKVMKMPFKFTFQPLDMLKEIGGGTWGRRATQVMDDLITAAIKGGASLDDAMEIRNLRLLKGFTGNTTREFRALGILGKGFLVSMSLAGSVLRSFLSPLKRINVMIKVAKDGWKAIQAQVKLLAFTEDVTGALAIPKKMTQYIVASWKALSVRLARGGFIARGLRMGLMVPFEIAYGTMNKIFKLDNWIKGGMKSPLAAWENWLNVDGLGVVNVDKQADAIQAAYGQLFKRRGPKAFSQMFKSLRSFDKTLYGKLRETMMGMSDDVLALAKKGDISSLYGFVDEAIKAEGLKLRQVDINLLDEMLQNMLDMDDLKASKFITKPTKMQRIFAKPIGKLVDGLSYVFKPFIDELGNLWRFTGSEIGRGFDYIGGIINRRVSSLASHFKSIFNRGPRIKKSAWGSDFITSITGMSDDTFRLFTANMNDTLSLNTLKSSGMSKNAVKEIASHFDEIQKYLSNPRNLKISGGITGIADDIVRTLSGSGSISDEMAKWIHKGVRDAFTTIDDVRVDPADIRRMLPPGVIKKGLAPVQKSLPGFFADMFTPKVGIVAPGTVEMWGAMDDFGRMFTRLGGVVTKVATGPFRLLATQAKAVAKNFSTVGEIFGKVFPMFDRFGTAGPKVALALTGAAVASFLWSRNLFGLKDAFGGVVGGIGDGIKALASAWQENGLAGVIDEIELGITNMANDLPGTISAVANSPAWDKLFTIFGMVAGIFMRGPWGLLLAVAAPLIAKGATAIVNSIGRVSSAWAKNGWEGAVKAIGFEIHKALGGAGKRIRNFGRSVMNVGDALGSIPGIGGPLKSFFNTVGGSIHNFGNRILNVQGYFDQARAQGLNPFKAAVHALGKEFPVLGAAMTAFGQVWPTMWEGLKDIGSNFAQAFSGVVEIIKGFFNLIKGLIQMMTGDFDAGWETIKHGASQLWDGVLNIFGAALSLLSMAVDGIGVIFSTVFSGIGNIFDGLAGKFPAFAGVFELIGEKARTIGGVIQDVFGVIAALMRGDWSDAWDHFKSLASGIADLVFTGPELFIELITGTDWDAVTNGLSNWGDKLSELGPIGWVVSLPLKALEVILRAIVGWVKDLGKAWGEVKKILAGDWGDVNWDTLTKPFPAINDFVGDMGTLKDIINGDWDKVSWEDILDLAGLDGVAKVLQKTWDLMNMIANWGKGEEDTRTPRSQDGKKIAPTIIDSSLPGNAGTAGAWRNPDGSISVNYNKTPGWESMGDAYIDVADPYNPYDPGAAMGKIQAQFISAANKLGQNAGNKAMSAFGQAMNQSSGKVQFMSPAAIASLQNSITGAKPVMVTGWQQNQNAMNVENDAGWGRLNAGTALALANMGTIVGGGATQIRTNAGTQFEAMRTGISTTFGTMAADMAAKGLVMSTENITRWNTINLDSSNASTAMRQNVGARGTEMGTAFGNTLSGMSSSAATQFLNMRASAESNTLSAALLVGANTGSMADYGISAMNRMGTGMGASLAGISGNLAGQALNWAVTVSLQGATMYNSGYSIGSRLSNGVADGMLSALGRITASAQLIIATARMAAAAAAMIHSPSRLFYDTIGIPIGLGAAGGISSPESMRAISASSRKLVEYAAAQSYVPSDRIGSIGSASSGGGTTIVHIDQSDNSINTTGSPEELVQIKKSAVDTRNRLKNGGGARKYRGTIR